jgi:hypothetical protein
MNAAEARRRVREILDQGGALVYTRHGGNRQRQRQIPIPEVMRVLRSGFVVEAPHRETGREGWTLAMEGADADGHRLRVVLEVSPVRLEIRVITAFRPT